MREAIAYFLNILFDRVGCMVSLRYWADEVNLLVETCMQSYFLIRQDALYQEYFYNLKRHSNGKILPTHRILTVLVELVSPYFMAKLNRLFHNIRIEGTDSSTKRAFFKVIPWLFAMHGLANFYLQLRHLLETPFKIFSLKLLLLRI